MTFDQYQLEAGHTWNLGRPADQRVLNAALGLAGEVGEVIELIKKAQFHGKPYESDTMNKELGDVLYYLTILCAEHGQTLEGVARANNEKLKARYPNGFAPGGGNR